MAIRGSYLDVQGRGWSSYDSMIGRASERSQSCYQRSHRYLDSIREQEERNRRRFEAVDERHRVRFEAIDDRNRKRYETLSGRAFDSTTRHGSALVVERAGSRYQTLSGRAFESRTRYGSVSAVASSGQRRYDSALGLLFERYESLVGRALEPVPAYESLLGRAFEQYRGHEATVGRLFEQMRAPYESLFGRIFEHYRGYESRLGRIFEQNGAGYESALRIVEQISWDVHADADTNWLDDDGETWWIGQLPAIVRLRLLVAVLTLLELSSQKQADFTGEGLPPDFHSGVQILIGLAATILVFMEAKAKLAADNEAGAARRAE